MSDFPFQRVAVLGLGVIGGSVARALAELCPAVEHVGWSPEPSEREEALESGAVHGVADLWEEAVRGADLVVLAAPLEACRTWIGVLARETGPEVTLMDVASLKGPLLQAAEEAGVLDRWVGAHPMAGSEGSGFGRSRSDLFLNARVWLVTEGAAEERLTGVCRLWEALGARPEQVDAEIHDRTMALASHLPQLVSNVLAGVLAERGVGRDELGPGGRDMTRLATGGVSMWRDLLAHAPTDLAAALQSVSESASIVARDLESQNLESVVALMERTVAWGGDQ